MLSDERSAWIAVWILAAALIVFLLLCPPD